jgi:phosphatidylserine/phosphatidylglycerophosphate/cardiolipin synthase-like enzyme
MLVIRYHDDPSRDIAYVGGIDLCHSRRDDARHHGDPQPQPMAREYGATPPWHDLQAAITGPAVHDVETVFRERWDDPAPLSRNPIHWLRDRLTGDDRRPDPLPAQAPAPPPVDGGTHVVQLLRTYPDLLFGRDYGFANGGERSVARGYTKALRGARRFVYLEDQYVWGHHVGDVFTEALRTHPDLHLVAVVPLHTDLDGMSRQPELLGRRRAMVEMLRVAPDRVAFFGIENHHSTPVYVHAKTCIVDDTWATVGSDNFNRRSWTHDSELTAVVVDRHGAAGGYGQRLRLTLAAEHLDREVDDESLLDVMADCVDPHEMFGHFVDTAARLDDWHAGGRVGERPPGRLRRMHPPELGRMAHALSLPPYLTLHDPDGRPRRLKREGGF